MKVQMPVKDVVNASDFVIEGNVVTDTGDAGIVLDLP